MSNSSQFQSTSCLAVPARQVAKLLSISERHVWKLDANGLLPAPARLGRAVRWSVSELKAWQTAGCPSRKDWEQIKSGKGESECT